MSDTNSREGRTIPIWRMKPQYEGPVLEALENSYGESADKSDFAECTSLACSTLLSLVLPPLYCLSAFPANVRFCSCSSRYRFRTVLAISRKGISEMSLTAPPRMDRVSGVLKS